MLDSEYRPVEGGEPVPPPYPARLRWFLYACAMVAQEEEERRAAGKAGQAAMR